MKKILIMAAAVVATLASCSKDMENNTPIDDYTDGPQVHFTLKAESQSRAFFDNTAAAEEWEKEVTSLLLYAFDNSGKILIKRVATAAELTAGTVKLPLPNRVVDKECYFYAIANNTYDGTKIVKKSQLESLIEHVSLDEYNGNIGETIDGRKRADGFVMTGKTSATICKDTPTEVGVTLRRQVAKIAVKTQMSDDFSEKFGGGIVYIESVSLVNVSPVSYVFQPSGSLPVPPFAYKHEQTPREMLDSPHNYTQNLFYSYESHLSERTSLVLCGYYYPNGLGNDLYNRVAVEYKVDLDGEGDNNIARNAYYRINVKIGGLSGESVTVEFTVADWEVPITQEVTLG